MVDEKSESVHMRTVELAYKEASQYSKHACDCSYDTIKSMDISESMQSKLPEILQELNKVPNIEDDKVRTEQFVFSGTLLKKNKND